MREATFTPDRAVYIRAHVLMALIGGLAATAILYALGNPHGWVGMPAAILGIFVRGWFMMSEELTHVWTLGREELTSTMGRRVTLDSIAKVKTLGSAAQVITTGGNKYLIKFLADPAAAKSTIEFELTRNRG